MTAYRMLYAAAVGLPVLVAAFTAAAVLRRHGRAERWVWLLGLALSLALPVLLLGRPLASVGVAPEARQEASGVNGQEAAEGATLRFTNVIRVQRASAGFGLDETLLLAWILASAGLALRWVVSTRRLARLTGTWDTRSVDGTDVWLTPTWGPAVTGVLRTRILVPEWMLALPEGQRTLVLLHEREHVRARDPWLLTACRAARIVTPWNPVVWVLSARLLHAVETDCDRRVLRRHPDVRTYCDTLFAISARQPSRLVGAAAFAEPQIPLHERILAMTTPPRSLSVLGGLSLLGLAALLVFGSCGVPVPTDTTLDPRASLIGEDPNWVTIVVSAAGRVVVEGEPVAIADVSTVMARQAEAATGHLVARLWAERDVPYRRLAEMQQELMEAGVTRVVFHVESGSGGAAARELSIVLPERAEQAKVSGGRNVLHFDVQPSGTVEVRRGEAAQVQTLRPQDVTGLWRQDAARNPNLIAFIRHSPDATYAQVMDVLGALYAASARRIALSGEIMQ